MAEWMAGAAIVFVAGVIQGCSGFGFGLVSSPCLMLVVPPTVAVPTVVMLSAVSTFMIAVEARRHIRPRLVGPIFAGALIGLPLGTYALHVLDGALLKVFVGVFATGAAVAILAGLRRPVPNHVAAMAPVGVAAGFLGGSAAMGGPPIVLFMANQGFPKNIFRANLVCYFFLTNCMLMGLHAFSGILTPTVAGRVLLYVPVLVLGTAAGIRLARHVSETAFRRFSMALVAVIGIILLAMNLPGLLSAS